MAVRPDSVEVEFGIKFDAEAGAVIAKTGVEAAVTVKLAWGPPRLLRHPGHRSFCLITTRAPVFALVPFVTYQQIDVDPLQPVPGRELLRKLGVHGPDASLDQIVRDWGGHALTLSLMAAYLTKRYGGDVRRVASLPAPDQGRPRDAMVRRILHEYDACLTDEERSFLTRYSVFRTPVLDEALHIVLPDTP